MPVSPRSIRKTYLPGIAKRLARSMVVAQFCDATKTEIIRCVLQSGCDNDYQTLCRMIIQRCLTAHTWIQLQELLATVTALATYAGTYRPPDKPFILKMLDSVHIAHYY